MRPQNAIRGLALLGKLSIAFLVSLALLGKTKEYPYLFNAAAFNDTTMDSMVVSRLWLTKPGILFGIS